MNRTRINDTEAHFELTRASRYGWQASSGFYAPAPKRVKQKKPGFVRMLGAAVRALFA